MGKQKASSRAEDAPATSSGENYMVLARRYRPQQFADLVGQEPVARALVNDPVLLVLDEPSEGMDLAARRLLHKIIRERQELGHTAILVSHLLTDVERLCNRVAVLRQGRLGFVGRVDELKRVNGGQEPDAASSSNFEDALEPYYAGVAQ